MTTAAPDETARRLLATLAAAESLAAFDRAALDGVRDTLGARSATLWRATPPSWTVVAGAAAGEPPEAVVEAIDRDGFAAVGGWSAACCPAPAGAAQGDVLALAGDADGATLVEVAELLARARGIAERTLAAERRVGRADELLTLSLVWGESHDTAALLERMAESATRLFAADRATVFLWDRAAGRLVGRPALGLPEGRLVVGDDVGVVGRVVRTGRPERVSAGGAAQLDRSTDRATGYRTESVVCVPLDGPGGERLGAFELLNKREGDFTDDDEAGLAEFARLAAVALANARQVEELVERRDTMVDEAASGVRLLGEAPAIAALRSTIKRVADADLAVLVLGENGTGKEVVAQSLHFQSRRRSAPLLAVNCAAIAESLLESELFGHEAGAFTDAREARAGKFELADGGTLLLDEIGDMSPAGQAKLLRVLEDKTVVRVGGAEGRTVDVRVVAATNRDLAARVREGRFREDLYYRLCVVTLELPPLRERGTDTLLLAEHFLERFCAARGRRPPRLSPAAREKLLGHPFPGNVRELRNLTERVAYLSEGPTVEPADLGLVPPPRGAGVSDEADPDATLSEATRRFQRRHVTRAIDRHRGNVAAAARDLGLHRSNLYRKMKQLGMDPGEGDE